MSKKKAVAKRDDKGRFLKGQSGNPAGLPAGTRQRITQEKLAMEQALRLYMADEKNARRILGSIDRLLDIVETGEDKVAVSAIKVLTDKVLPTLKPEEEQQKGPNRIEITIDTSAVKGESAVRAANVMDGEYTEIPIPNEETST